MIGKFSKLIPKTLMEMSGAVFYSGKNAFDGKKDFYILGLNPGGNPDLQKEDTVALNVLNSLNFNFTEYLNGAWKDGYKPGESPLQRRILHLLNKLNLCPYDVPASNICFVRSIGENEIKNNFIKFANLCWPFHKHVIEDLEIKIILCFGKSAGNNVRNKIGADRFPIDEFVERNNRKWKTQVFKNSNGIIVIVATHSSRADWTKIDTDISPLVKKYLDGISN
ncbi:MAG: hypothetical protein IPP32_16545 [Bacteroidetes bacterium]|nr:hypothetical protein [Bacteroidota bacterium]